MPRASAQVAQALAAAPITFGLRDMRQDPTAVGVYEESKFVVRTTDNVAQYCTDRMGDMLLHAGAHLIPAPTAVIEIELLDYNVVEGNTFSGAVQFRAVVHRSSGAPWAKAYEGTSKRWGRTHNPDNFNEALSNALADATSQLIRDAEFAAALAEAPQHAGLPGG